MFNKPILHLPALCFRSADTVNALNSHYAQNRMIKRFPLGYVSPSALTAQQPRQLRGFSTAICGQLLSPGFPRSIVIGMHWHAYNVPDMRIAPPSTARAGWAPERVFDEENGPVEWLVDSMRELIGKPEVTFADESQLWSQTLETNSSIHTGARGTLLIVESKEGCDCQSANSRIASIRRGRRQ